MGLSITIDGDTRLFRQMDSAAGKIKDARVFLGEVGDLAIREFTDNFDAEGKRMGEPWKPLAASTVRQKAMLGYGNQPILVRTGKLQKGFEKKTDKVKVVVSNKVPYYRYHQLGEGHNPVRRMIVASEKLKQEIIQVARIALKMIFN